MLDQVMQGSKFLEAFCTEGLSLGGAPSVVCCLRGNQPDDPEVYAYCPGSEDTPMYAEGDGRQEGGGEDTQWHL